MATGQHPCPVARAWYYANRRAVAEPADRVQLHMFDADYDALRYHNRTSAQMLYKHAGTVAFKVRPPPGAEPPPLATPGGRRPWELRGEFLTFEGASEQAAAAGGSWFWVMPSWHRDPNSGRFMLTGDHLSFFPAPGKAGRALDIHLTTYTPKGLDPDANVDKGATVHTRAPRLPATFTLPATAAELQASRKLGDLSGASPLVWRLLRRPFDGEPGTVPPDPRVMQSVAAQAAAAAQGGGGRRAGRGGAGRRRAARHEAQRMRRGQQQRTFADLWVELPLRRLVVVVLPLPHQRDRAAVTVFMFDRTGNPPGVAPQAAYRELPAAAVGTREGLEAAVSAMLADYSWHAFVYPGPRDP